MLVLTSPILTTIRPGYQKGWLRRSMLRSNHASANLLLLFKDRSLSYAQLGPVGAA